MLEYLSKLNKRQFSLLQLIRFSKSNVRLFSLIRYELVLDHLREMIMYRRKISEPMTYP